MNVSVLRLLPLLVLLAAPLGACSLVLDPSECSGDGDCNGGVCQDGICVGELPVVEPDAAVDAGPPPADAGPDAAGDAAPPSDAAPDGAAPDAAPDAGPDAAEPDAVPPDPQPPTCAFVAPPPMDRLTNAEMIGVTIQVLDEDTPPDGLTVTLDGEEVTLDEEGFYTLEDRPAEGETVYELVAEDDTGLRCEDRLTVTVDRTGPTIRRELPAGDRELRGQAEAIVRACVEDPHGVDSVRATLRGLPVEELREDGRCLMRCNGTCVEATVELVDGENPLMLTARDALGNASEEYAFTLVYDGTPPEITVAEPADGIAIAVDRVTVRGTVREPGGDVRQTRVSITVTGPGGEESRNEGIQVAPDGAFVVEEVQLYSGLNRLDVCADDPAGNQACAAREVFVETEPPCVAIESPADGAILGEGRVEVCGRACETVETVVIGFRLAERDMVPPGNRIPADLQPDGAFCAEVSLPSAGQYVLTAIASSRAGQTAEESVSVVLDDTPPVIRIASPGEGACLGGEEVEICGQVTDIETSVTRLRVAGEVAFPRADGTFCHAIAVDEGPDQELVVTARNPAELEATASVTVTVDRTPPTVEFEFEDGGYVAADDEGLVFLRGRLVDGGCGVVANGLRVDGTVVPVRDDGGFTYRRALGAGEHELAFTAQDAVGNATTVHRRVIVDAEPPTVEVLEPEPGTATIDDEIAVAARVADAAAGIDTVRIGGLEAQLEQTDDGTIARATVPLMEGSNEITIEATDRVGLVGRSQVTVLRDLEEPVVAVTSPEAGAAVESLLYIEGTVDDGAAGSGVARVTVNGVEATLSPDRRSWSLEGVRLARGENVLTIFAMDRAGNESLPLEHTVVVRDFAPTDPARLGLGVATAVAWVGAADLDGDGRLDIVALSGEDDGTSAVYLQQENGTFIGRPAEVAGLRSGTAVTAAALGDFNNDGHADLAVGYSDGAELRLGRGNGNFERSGVANLPAGVDVRDLAAGDIDRDRDLDLVMLAGLDSALLFGDGIGGFDAVSMADAGLNELATAAAARLIDLDRDRVQDLVAVGPNTARLWTGDREAGFVPVDPAVSGFTDAGAAAALPVDADRDGDLDLFAPGAQPRFYLAGAPGEGWSVDDLGLAAAVATPWAAVVDVDGDARDDVVLGGPEGLQIWEADAAGFAPRDVAAAGVPPLAVTGPVEAVDIDGDGDFDVLAVTADGLRLVRSNRSVTADPYRVVRLAVRRARAGRDGPADAVGIYLTGDLNADATPDRALVVPPFGPALFTLGAAPSVDLVVHFIDQGDPGADRRNLDGRVPGPIETVHAPE